MIRFLVKTPEDGGPPVVFLGISDENVARLRAGQPILTSARDARQLGLGNNRIVIFHGATEQDMTRELEEQGFLPPGSTERVEETMKLHGRLDVTPEGEG